MVDSCSARSSQLILCIVPGSRYAGYAALDGFGLAPAGFRSVNLKRVPKSQRLTRLMLVLARVLRTLRPARLVLGLSPYGQEFARALCQRLHRLAKRLGIVFTSRRTSEALLRVLGRSRQGRRGDLGLHLRRHFRLDDALPKRGRGSVNLAARVARYGEHVRCHRAAWQATALALMELTEQRPFAAGALLREGVHVLPAFERMLTAATNRAAV